MACPFCAPPIVPRHGGVTTIAVLATDLCAEHYEYCGAAAFDRAHPLVDGKRPCTEGCGCQVDDGATEGG